MLFADRRDAGRQLARLLLRHRAERPVVLALPRGGVPVGYEVARALGAPLDILVVRKLGAPGQPELGIGAIVDGEQPQAVLNEDVVRLLDVSDEYLRQEIARELHEIRRRQAAYRGGHEAVEVVDRTAILVDDGLATGASMRAAIRGVRRARPHRIVLAVPVAPPDTIASLRAEVDDVACLSTPELFGAVGNFYEDFTQTSDAEVVELLAAARRSRAVPGGAAPAT
jgi:putative phosphoribosyl transferase